MPGNTSDFWAVIRRRGVVCSFGRDLFGDNGKAVEIVEFELPAIEFAFADPARKTVAVQDAGRVFGSAPTGLNVEPSHHRPVINSCRGSRGIPRSLR